MVNDFARYLLETIGRNALKMENLGKISWIRFCILCLCGPCASSVPAEGLNFDCSKRNKIQDSLNPGNNERRRRSIFHGAIADITAIPLCIVHSHTPWKFIDLVTSEPDTGCCAKIREHKPDKYISQSCEVTQLSSSFVIVLP